MALAAPNSWLQADASSACGANRGRCRLGFCRRAPLPSRPGHGDKITRSMWLGQGIGRRACRAGGPPSQKGAIIEDPMRPIMGAAPPRRTPLHGAGAARSGAGRCAPGCRVTAVAERHGSGGMRLLPNSATPRRNNPHSPGTRGRIPQTTRRTRGSLPCTAGRAGVCAAGRAWGAWAPCLPARRPREKGPRPVRGAPGCALGRGLETAAPRKQPFRSHPAARVASESTRACQGPHSSALPRLA